MLCLRSLGRGQEFGVGEKKGQKKFTKAGNFWVADLVYTGKTTRGVGG